MAGINIPIRGDTRGLLQAVKELTGVMRSLGKDMVAVFAPARAAAMQTAAATRDVGKESRRSSASLGAMVAKTAAGITAAAGLAGAVATLGKEVPQLIRVGRTIAMSIREPLAQATRESQGFLAALGRFSKTPAFKYLMAGAAASAVAIGGLLLSIRGGMGVLRAFGSVAGSVFRGLANVARSTASVVRGAFSGLKGLMPSLSLGGGGGLFGGVAGLIGIGGALALVVSQAKQAFQGAAAFEELQTRVESFTGSAVAAKALLGELKAFADATLFSTRGVQEAAESLLGAGITKDVAGITKDLAALAKSDQVLGELADALGKGFAKGKFQTEELNKFLERGINLIPQLTAVTGLAGKELTKAIEAGLGFDLVVNAIGRMSAAGGQFYGVLARLGMTFSGLWSTFTSGLAEIRKAFAMPVLQALKPMLQEAIALTANWAEQAKRMGEALANGVRVAFALMKNGQAGEALKTGVSYAFRSGVDILMRGLRGAIAYLAAALPAVVEAGTQMLRNPAFWRGIVDIFSGLGQIMASELMRLNPLNSDEDIQVRRSFGQRSITAGRMGIENAGTRSSLDSDLRKALESASAAAETAFKGMAESPELQKLRLQWRLMILSVGEEVRKLQESVMVPPPTQGATGAGIGTRVDAGFMGESMRGMQPYFLQTSMSRVGGGGTGVGLITPIVSEAKKTNSILTKIEKNTSGGGGGGGAEYQ